MTQDKHQNTRTVRYLFPNWSQSTSKYSRKKTRSRTR